MHFFAENHRKPDASQYERKDFRLNFADEELRELIPSPIQTVDSISEIEQDFDSGKMLLKSLDFDPLVYSSDTLVDLSLEIFMEVLLVKPR
jgi:hypothetical protein